MQRSAKSQRLTIRYLLEEADIPLRAQIFILLKLGILGALAGPSPIVSHSDGSILNNSSSQTSELGQSSRNSGLLGKSNNLLTFRSFVFPPDVGEGNEELKNNISRP